MNERIKKLRKALDLTQQEFGDRIGIKRNTLANYEIGRNEPIDAVISLICREFNVSETWLRTGEGEMFREKTGGALETLAEQYGLSRGALALVEEFVNLKPDIQQAFVDYAVKVAQSYQDPAPPSAETEREQWEQEAREEAELFYQQRLSEKRQASPASSASELGAG